MNATMKKMSKKAKARKARTEAATVGKLLEKVQAFARESNRGPGLPKGKLWKEKRRCVDCKRNKLLYSDFRPRWRGCAEHADEKTGRRWHEPGCPDCAKVLLSRTRQPRCIACDSKRRTKPPTVFKKKQAKPVRVVARKTGRRRTG